MWPWPGEVSMTQVVGGHRIIQPLSSCGSQVPFLPVLGHTEAELVMSTDLGTKLSEFKCAFLSDV